MDDTPFHGASPGKRDIIRCLKRYVIRETYQLIKVNPRTGEITS